MGGGKTPGDLDPEIDRPADGQAPLPDLLAQRLPLEQLGDEVRLALVPANVVQDKDVRVAEHRGGSGLLLEPAQSIGIGSKLRRQDLDGNVSAEASVARTVHLAHPTSSNGCDDLVRTDAGAG
jgi:hypothetical protein